MKIDLKDDHASMSAAVGRVVDLVAMAESFASARDDGLTGRDIEAAWAATYSGSDWSQALIARASVLAIVAGDGLDAAARVGALVVAEYASELMASAVIVAQLVEQIAHLQGVESTDVLRALVDTWTQSVEGSASDAG